MRALKTFFHDEFPKYTALQGHCNGFFATSVDGDHVEGRGDVYQFSNDDANALSSSHTHCSTAKVNCHELSLNAAP